MSGAELAVLLPMLGEAAAGTAAAGTAAAAPALATGMMGTAAATPFLTEAAALGAGGFGSGMLAPTVFGMGSTMPTAASMAPFAAGMGPGAASAWQTALTAGMPAGAGSASGSLPWAKMAKAAGQGLMAGDDQQQQRAPAAPLPNNSQQAGTMSDAGMAWMTGGLLGGMDEKSRQMLMARMMRGAR